MKQILWWLIAGSKGGTNRARIILTQMFGLDYKTVRHHLDVLKKHQVIRSTGEGYGTMYSLSDQMMTRYEDFVEIWTQIDVPADLREE